MCIEIIEIGARSRKTCSLVIAHKIRKAQRALAAILLAAPLASATLSAQPAKRPNILIAIAEMETKYGLRCCNVFHAGDGNLHPLILYDGAIPAEVERTERLAGRILEECLALGGTITGEHGIGAEKIDKACRQFADPVLEDYFAVKRAFDPAGLLNPGKAIPTLARCAELRGSHVHHGQLPHPELERF